MAKCVFLKIELQKPPLNRVKENALYHKLANFFQNSNFDIAGAKEPSALAMAMSKFDF